MSEDQVEYVRTWLEESGYGLELRLASALRSKHGYVGQSVPYSDPTEGKLREADVIYMHEALMDSGQPARVSVVFECKNSKKTPWAVFDVPKERAYPTANTQAVIRGVDDHAVLERVNELLSDDPIFSYEWFGNAVVAARKGEDTEGLNAAHRAVRQVVSATYGVVEVYRNVSGVKVFIPAIVTSAPIMTCRLVADSDEIEITPIEYAQVRTVPEGKQRPVTVHVMSEAYASTEFATVAERLARRLGPPPPRSTPAPSP